MPPPIQMIQAKRFISTARRPLPQTTIGSERPMPKTTRKRSPWAAAATASTLSRLMIASATMMIQTASRNELPWRTWPSAPVSLRTSLNAIQKSTRPPRSCSRGIRRRSVAIAMNATRRPTAPAVPQTRPQNCWRWGSVRTASAMTSALSPASVRSMITIPEPGPELGVHEEQHTSLHQRLEHRDQDAAHDQERDGDRQAFVTVHSHLVSPYEMDGRDAPPGGGSGQETDGMTKLVVVGRRGRHGQRGARRRMERRRVPGRLGPDAEVLAGRRILTRLAAALGRGGLGRDRASVLGTAAHVHCLLDLRVPDLEAEGPGQDGIGEVEDQVGEHQEQEPARPHTRRELAGKADLCWQT